MAKNIKDLLSIFNNLINSNEISAILSASNLSEVEIQDEDFDKIQDLAEGLLTVESAITNKEVKDKLHQLHKKSFMKEVEENMKPLAELLEATEEYSQAENAKEKIKVLSDKFTEFKESKPTSGGDEKLKEQNITLKKQLADKEKAIADIQAQSEQRIGETQKEYENRLLKKAFYNELNNRFKLADAYNKPEIKQAIMDRVYQEVSKEAKLQLNESDSIEIFDKETEGSPFFLKGSNKPAGIEDLVGPKIQDYIKVSEPEDKSKKPEQKSSKPAFETGTMADEMARKRQEYFSGMTA